MDRQLIWLIKSACITPTKRRLDNLLQSEYLLDEGDIDLSDECTQREIRSFNFAVEHGYGIVTYIDSEYPKALREISLPPRVLYVYGDKGALAAAYAGIVGSRKPDSYGLRIAAEIALEIGHTGVGTVSGGAEGIDAAAHKGALRAGAKTIAVLGCGLDVGYPRANQELFRQIAQSGGAVISEFPFGTRPDKMNFPHRNRIIAAMSLAVVVVRAGARSGALITANHAERMGKTVFAVPGNIEDGLSAGTNGLIRDGAMIMTSYVDIIDELVLKLPQFFADNQDTSSTFSLHTENPKEQYRASEKTMPNLKLTDAEQEVVTAISGGYTRAEDIERQVTFSPALLTGTLGMLEIKGIVKRGINREYKLLIGGKS